MHLKQDIKCNFNTMENWQIKKVFYYEINGRTT